MFVAVKRVYEKPIRSDGIRILVDRLWPRGLTKEGTAVLHWLRDLAPSNELRRWFHTHREEWATFRMRYLNELKQPSAATDLEELYAMTRKHRKVTLLFASKDHEHNNAIVLRDLLNGMRKPPSSAGATPSARARRPRRVRS